MATPSDSHDLAPVIGGVSDDRTRARHTWALAVSTMRDVQSTISGFPPFPVEQSIPYQLVGNWSLTRSPTPLGSKSVAIRTLSRQNSIRLLGRVGNERLFGFVGWVQPTIRAGLAAGFTALHEALTNLGP